MSLLLMLYVFAWGAEADDRVAGRAAQAVRCAAYVGMAAQYGYGDGIISREDRNVMALWSVMVLERWVPGDTAGRLAAYGRTLGELGAPEEARRLAARHLEPCLRAFTPALPGGAT